VDIAFPEAESPGEICRGVPCAGNRKPTRTQQKAKSVKGFPALA
jgi:hypothetical protein